MTSSRGFDAEFKNFEHELDQNTAELETDRRESTRLIQEIEKAKEEIKERERLILADKRHLDRLAPEIRELEREKMENHRKLQQLEERNRARLNEQGVKIKPVNLGY